MGLFHRGIRSLFGQHDAHAQKRRSPVGPPAAPAPPATPPRHSTSAPAVDALVTEAITIVDEHVEPGAQVHFGGSDSPVMGAADKLGEAHRLQPDDPCLHYAWASALAAAFQFATAREEMDRLVVAHPDFLPARFAVAGWDRWTPLFDLPSWGSGDPVTPDPLILRLVQRALLVATRDRLVPRATLFFRDAGGEFAPTALREATIDLATVVSPHATTPQLVALYARVNDNPGNPYVIEQLGFPFAPRGDRSRLAYELLGTQSDLDIAVLSASGAVVHNRRVRVPAAMRAVHERLASDLLGSDGEEITTSKITRVVPLHTAGFGVDQAPFERAEPVRHEAPAIVLV